MPRELVLNFHGIGDPHPGTDAAERAVWMGRALFVQLLDQVVALRATEQIPIVITFDDGNSSDASIALPELSARQMTAKFFVCAGRIGVFPYLEAPAIRDLLAAGMQIGSHGMHHRNWRELNEVELTEEISVARKQIEDVCGTAVCEAGIPFGSYDRRVLGRLRSEGFTCAYTSDRGFARSSAWLKSRNTLGTTSTSKDIVQLVAMRRSPASVLQEARRLFKAVR